MNDTYLTPKESEVVMHLKQGKTAKQIAWELGSSHHTVTSHITNIKAKLRCTSILQLGLELGKSSKLLYARQE
jgi:DNA-binding CsgD family transcriptional regulator